jgi:hypothetical protein
MSKTATLRANVEFFFAVHRKFNAVHDRFQTIGRFLLLQLDDAEISLFNLIKKEDEL